MTAEGFSTILTSMPRGRLIAFLFILVSLILAGIILTDIWPFLRGPAPETSEWYWPHLLRPFSRWWPSLLAASALLGVGGWWLRREDEQARLPLTLLVLLILALQLGLIYADRSNVGAELVDRTLSKASNGYLATAGEIDDLNEALRHFPELMPAFDNDHARTHPPGFVAALWLTDRALRRLPGLAETLARPATFWRCTDLWVLARPPATAASLLIWSWQPFLLAALTIVPAFQLSRRWFAPLPARLAALLAATSPALLVFVPTPDQIFACLAALSLLLMVIGLRRMSWATVLVAGWVVSLMSFLSLGNAAWAATLGAYGLWWLIWPGTLEKPSPQKSRRWVIFLSFAAGAASVWLVYWVGWGVAPWAIARAGLGQHYDLVTSLRRYDWWMVYNLVDFFVFAGPPVVAGLVWRLVETWRGREEGYSEDGRLAIILPVIMIAIDLSGSTRGEVGRLWLVFMPAAAIVAGGILGRRLRHWRNVWLVFLAQIIMVLGIGLGWRAFYAVILPVERPAMALTAATVKTDITFSATGGREIRLIGYDAPQLTVHAGDILETTLYWQSNGSTLRPYTVFMQLLDTDGEIIAQQDRWPVDGHWPSTCWIAGETVIDPYAIALPPDAPAGNYSLVTGLYDASTGIRLQMEDGLDYMALIEITIE